MIAPCAVDQVVEVACWEPKIDNIFWHSPCIYHMCLMLGAACEWHAIAEHLQLWYGNLQLGGIVQNTVKQCQTNDLLRSHCSWGGNRLLNISDFNLTSIQQKSKTEQLQAAYFPKLGPGTCMVSRLLEKKSPCVSDWRIQNTSRTFQGNIATACNSNAARQHRSNSPRHKGARTTRPLGLTLWKAASSKMHQSRENNLGRTRSLCERAAVVAVWSLSTLPVSGLYKPAAGIGFSPLCMLIRLMRMLRWQCLPSVWPLLFQVVCLVVLRYHLSTYLNHSPNGTLHSASSSKAESAGFTKTQRVVTGATVSAASIPWIYCSNRSTNYWSSYFRMVWSPDWVVQYWKTRQQYHVDIICLPSYAKLYVVTKWRSRPQQTI